MGTWIFFLLSLVPTLAFAVDKPSNIICPGDPTIKDAALCPETFCRLPAKSDADPEQQNLPQHWDPGGRVWMTDYYGKPREIAPDAIGRVFEITLRTQPLASDGRPSEPAESQVVIDRINRCYAAASPFLWGPLPDGTRARILFKMVQGYAKDDARIYVDPGADFIIDAPGVLTNSDPTYYRPHPLTFNTYQTGEDCKSVLQETLSQIGISVPREDGLDQVESLVDEYPITERQASSQSTLTEQNTCRVIGPDDSFMRAHPQDLDHPTLTRFDQVSQDSGGYRILNCNCPSFGYPDRQSMAACRAKIRALTEKPDPTAKPLPVAKPLLAVKPVPGRQTRAVARPVPVSLPTVPVPASERPADACPQGTNTADSQLFSQLTTIGNAKLSVRLDGYLQQHLDQTGDDENDDDYAGARWIAKIPPASPANAHSILYPGQFRKILFPGCKRLNSVYDSCAAGAYVEVGIQGDHPSKLSACPARPKECVDGSAEWLQ